MRDAAANYEKSAAVVLEGRCGKLIVELRDRCKSEGQSFLSRATDETSRMNSP
jgi:hypothetical protein